jgi:hypothetical protein
MHNSAQFCPILPNIYTCSPAIVTAILTAILTAIFTQFDLTAALRYTGSFSSLFGLPSNP